MTRDEGPGLVRSTLLEALALKRFLLIEMRDEGRARLLWLISLLSVVRVTVNREPCVNTYGTHRM